MKRFFFIKILLCFWLLLGPNVSGAAGPWIDAKEYGGIAYFLFDSPPSIERYDLTNSQFLSGLPLAEAPTAFAVDADGIYVSFGRRTSRFALNGSGETHLRNTPTDVRALVTLGSYLYIHYESGYEANYVSLNKISGVQIDWKTYIYGGLNGISIAPTIRKIFGRDAGSSPSDIHQLTLNADGTLGSLTDSPYHGAYPGATMTFVFPGEARVTDNSGVVYNTADLTYNNSLAGAFDDLAFYGDLPIVLRGQTLYGYSNAFLETGQFTSSAPIKKIFVSGLNIYSFFLNDFSLLDVTTIPVNSLSLPPPGQPVNPNGLSYVPDAMELGQDGVVYLLSRANLSVFRWSINQRKYLQTIPLVQAPSYMAYSPVTHRLYLAYPSGKINQIKLSESTAESAFANLPQQPLGLATAGQYLFAVDPSGAWGSHYTYSPQGTLISQKEWNYYSLEYIWSPVNQKMYFFRDDTSPNDLLSEAIDVNGMIGTQMETPYHDSTGIIHPIRVAPDGTIVLLGSGRIYDASSLVLINALSNNINDAAWLNGKLFTLRSLSTYSQVQEWGVNYAIDSFFRVAGAPLRLFTVDNRLFIITDVGGKPRFSLIDPSAPRIDADADVILDSIDNCTQASNVEQQDSNGDGYGNLCDPDLNNDGVVSFSDLALMKSVFFGANADADLNGDGVVNFGDLAIMKTFFFKLPGPSGLAP